MPCHRTPKPKDSYHEGKTICRSCSNYSSTTFDNDPTKNAVRNNMTMFEDSTCNKAKGMKRKRSALKCHNSQ